MFAITWTTEMRSSWEPSDSRRSRMASSWRCCAEEKPTRQNHTRRDLSLTHRDRGRDRESNNDHLHDGDAQQLGALRQQAQQDGQQLGVVIVGGYHQAGAGYHLCMTVTVSLQKWAAWLGAERADCIASSWG